MKLLKKILVCLVIASLFLGMIVSYASAQGPAGAPPTQNVSPTFSDVNVKGNVITDGGYLQSSKKGVPAGLQAYVKGITESDFVTALILAVLSQSSPVAVKDLLIVEGHLWSGTAFFLSDVTVAAGGNLTADDVVTKRIITSYDEYAGAADGLAVEVTDKDGLKVEKDLSAGGKSTFTDDVTIGVADGATGDVAGKEDLIKIRAKDAWNLWNPKIESTGALDIISDGQLTIDSSFPGGGHNLDINGGTVTIDSINLIVKAFMSITFQDQVEFASEVDITSHLRADSVGSFHFEYGKLENVLPNAWNQYSISCPANEIMVDCVGYNFYDQIAGNIAKPIYKSGNQYYCDMYWYNNSTNTSDKLARLQAMCWDTDGP